MKDCNHLYYYTWRKVKGKYKLMAICAKCKKGFETEAFKIKQS